MSQALNSKKKFLTGLILLVIFSLAGWRVHMRVQTTMIGYELGRLKTTEAELLQERSLLKMELAKLTTKSHLMLASNYEDIVDGKPGKFASISK